MWYVFRLPTMRFEYSRQIFLFFHKFGDRLHAQTNQILHCKWDRSGFDWERQKGFSTYRLDSLLTKQRFCPPDRNLMTSLLPGSIYATLASPAYVSPRRRSVGFLPKQRLVIKPIDPMQKWLLYIFLSVVFKIASLTSFWVKNWKVLIIPNEVSEAILKTYKE